MQPQIGTNGVMLLGEALGEQDAKEGRPFAGGRHGFMLTRLLGWAGFERGDFTLANSVWCKPPNLAGVKDAAPSCRERHWETLLSGAKVIVPMGESALQALTGRGGVISTRGYIRPGPYESHVIPTVSPEFIVMGQAKYASVFINDVRKAVMLAQTGLPMQLTNYILDPLPMTALEWAREYRAALDRDPTIKLAYDIETPYADSDESERGEDASWTIQRISFSWKPFHAMSLVWSPSNMAAIKLILGSPGIKVDWNGSFDRPRVRHNGVTINGPLHDGMVAWHVLHSDLPKGLGFVSTFTCPWQPEWKHLSSQRPAFYNATDSDVTLRSMLAIEGSLRDVPGLWEVYDRDVIRFDPVLRGMERAGMPVNNETRMDRAQKLAERLVTVSAEIETLIPLEARRVSPANGFVRPPESTEGLIQIEVETEVKRCSVCQAINPLKPHFRVFKKPTEKKPQNPCAGASIVSAVESVSRWARLEEWKPSQTALLLYQSVKNRIIPHKYDKRTKTQRPSMDIKALKLCMRKYPDDPLYALVVKRRELVKIAGTYIGYLVEEGVELNVDDTEGDAN